MNTEVLKFAEACIFKGECERLGDSRKEKREYRKIRSLYLFLKENQRLYELIELLDHENPYVRLWAAAYTLQISPQKSEKVLEELIPLKGTLVGLSASITLKEWRKGNLNL